MAHTAIEIPGDPGAAEVERVQIVGGTDESPTVIVTYGAAGRHADSPMVRAEISFSDVLEYRWKAFDLTYEDFPEHEEDYAFGLIEVTDSRYIENMAAKGPLRAQPGQRFGPFLKEADVRHFRLAFDDWGELNVVALGVSVKQLPD